MTLFCIRLGCRTVLLFLSFVVGLPTLIFVGLVALPGILLSTIPARLGFETLSLGRFGTLSFGVSETEKVELRAKLALIRRDRERLRHPVRWPS